MIELALNKIEKSFGAEKVLKDISFDVNTSEKVGIVGKNGTGKTTIFKIISGIENYNKGSLSIKKGNTIGYLSQIPEYPKDYKVTNVLHEAFKEEFKISDEMRSLEEKMSNMDGDSLDKAMKKYGALQQKYDHLGGYEIDEKLSKICVGLKIDDKFKNRKFEYLSGGEKTTVELAKILLKNPNILLLDEPSNHLDLESIEWLEDFLSEYEGTVLVISHDRYFLDRVVSKILEVENGKINTFLGNYSYYLKEKERRVLEQLAEFKNQQKKIDDMEEAIKRFRVWGNMRDSEKMFKKAKQMERKLEKMDKLEKPNTEDRKIGLEFSSNKRSGNDVLKIKGLCKSFDENRILKDLDLFVKYQERLAILGKNGSGKSTLLKIILDKYKKDSGEIKIGSRVKIGYLEQSIYFKDEKKSVLETFMREFTIGEGEARNKLARFLFYGDDVFKKIYNLSGGEKSRLKLAMLMYKDINLLILDEPTNHLDIGSREMLEEALNEFNGTIVFISHDRYFINKIAKRIVELRNKKLVNYLGNYEYYKEKKKEEKQEIEKIKQQKKEKNKVKNNKKNKTKPKKKGINKWKLKELEEQINEHETLLEKKEQEMKEYARDFEKLNEIHKEKSKIQEKLDSLLDRWVEICEEK
ncbi:MAG: ABC-F type ribosomal protection protein [Firmicutes bacterium]|nr:ABC-F type ribosomal protection protein [Bacillota bacterium]